MQETHNIIKLVSFSKITYFTGVKVVLQDGHLFWEDLVALIKAWVFWVTLVTITHGSATLLSWGHPSPVASSAAFSGIFFLTHCLVFEELLALAAGCCMFLHSFFHTPNAEVGLENLGIFHTMECQGLVLNPTLLLPSLFFPPVSVVACHLVFSVACCENCNRLIQKSFLGCIYT